MQINRIIYLKGGFYFSVCVDIIFDNMALAFYSYSQFFIFPSQLDKN